MYTQLEGAEGKSPSRRKKLTRGKMDLFIIMIFGKQPSNDITIFTTLLRII